jgi:hypothetical protein
MWLPKEERKLLVIYYVGITEGLKRVDSTVTAEKWYSMSDLIAVLKAKNVRKAAKELRGDYHKSVERMYDEPDEAETSNRHSESEDHVTVADMEQWLKAKAEIDTVNATLRERKLINLSTHTRTSDVGVSLTMEGYDLGMKYSKWPTKVSLWVGEYPWIWLIIAGVIGAVILKVVDWLL